MPDRVQQATVHGFPNAYSEKVNDARTGSKDDSGMEIVSIMFEMKNEMDTTSTKHKNEDFFKELDKDKREKHCEYAILVSLLEPDNDLYNSGIVDVSYRYEKMYVVRPQFFIPIITLLRDAAKNSLQYKNAVEEIDKSINHLKKIKDALLGSENQFRLANNKAQDVTIRRLTRNNESMKAKFDEVKKSKAIESRDREPCSHVKGWM
ncbi:DUF2130 domain-containing protein [uncultured Bifidobacterium sp.]|uniref:DUF2130 domain-containing protein n=1 Tax=uncultured Bifidobacterium sp. TaxID=165187 RepID=UPI0025E907AC|nr:DUF2130 domain-containing protein [uncultured Bifidobacterium sp.]